MILCSKLELVYYWLPKHAREVCLGMNHKAVDQSETLHLTSFGTKFSRYNISDGPVNS
jgi:hypothetical protein